MHIITHFISEETEVWRGKVLTQGPTSSKCQNHDSELGLSIDPNPYTSHKDIFSPNKHGNYRNNYEFLKFHKGTHT